MRSLLSLTADLEHLTEDASPPAPAPAAPPTAASAASATGKCPKGYHRYPPQTGKCVPRDSLRDAYRGHEPVAAMHREKSQSHAQAAQAAVAKGDYQKASHHADRARRHMQAAQRHHQEFDSIGKILYPHKHNPAMTHAGVKSPSNPGHAMQFPAVQAPKSHKSFGGSAWGSSGGSGDPKPQIHPQPSPSTPGFHPFGKPPEAHPTQSLSTAPTPPPVSPAQHHPTKPLGGAPTEPMAKAPTGLAHQVGKALQHGAVAAAKVKAHQTGSLGWHALSHALDHLLSPSQSGQTGAYGGNSHSAAAHAPTHPAMPAVHAPTAVDPEPKVPFQHVSPYASTAPHPQVHPQSAPKPKKKKPSAAPGPMSV